MYVPTFKPETVILTPSKSMSASGWPSTFSSAKSLQPVKTTETEPDSAYLNEILSDVNPILESIVLTVKFKILHYYPYKANWDII